jgi:hypothetical protein
MVVTIGAMTRNTIYHLHPFLSPPVCDNKAKAFKAAHHQHLLRLITRRTMANYLHFLVQLRQAALDLARIPSMRMMRSATFQTALYDSHRHLRRRLLDLPHDFHKSLACPVLAIQVAHQHFQ